MNQDTNRDDYSSRVMRIGIMLRERYTTTDEALAAADRLSSIARALRS